MGVIGSLLDDGQGTALSSLTVSKVVDFLDSCSVPLLSFITLPGILGNRTAGTHGS